VTEFVKVMVFPAVEVILNERGATSAVPAGWYNHGPHDCWVMASHVAPAEESLICTDDMVCVAPLKLSTANHHALEPLSTTTVMGDDEDPVVDLPDVAADPVVDLLDVAADPVDPVVVDRDVAAELLDPAVVDLADVTVDPVDAAADEVLDLDTVVDPPDAVDPVVDPIVPHFILE